MYLKNKCKMFRALFRYKVTNQTSQIWPPAVFPLQVEAEPQGKPANLSLGFLGKGFWRPQEKVTESHPTDLSIRCGTQVGWRVAGPELCIFPLRELLMMAEMVKQHKQTEQNQPTRYTGRGGAAYVPRGAAYFLKTALRFCARTWLSSTSSTCLAHPLSPVPMPSPIYGPDANV